MRILIAEDDSVSRRLLQALLSKWGYEVVLCTDGTSAWEALQKPDAPALAILDWMMPGIDGVAICQRLRTLPRPFPTYTILLTAKDRQEDLVAGLRAGADDYVVKPFDRDELQARVQVGLRVAGLQQALADRVKELEAALARVNQLHGLLPICSYCKKVRNDQNYWQQVELYVAEHSEAQFSHGVCPECYAQHLKPQLDLLRSPGSGEA
jgi:sigma-B regulation protein RsbU (phosphoserine phosphatase)